MAQYVANIQQITGVGGPYAYSILKDGVGLKAAVSIASISAAIDAVKTDIGSDLGGAIVTKTVLSVTTG